MNATKENKQVLTEQQQKELIISEFLNALRSDKTQQKSFIKALVSREKKVSISCVSCSNANSYHFSMTEFSNEIIEIAKSEDFKKLFASVSDSEIITQENFKKVFFKAVHESLNIETLKEKLKTSL